MIGYTIAGVIVLAACYLGWHLIPVIILRVKQAYTLSFVNRVMCFMVVFGVIGLYFIGLPSFEGVVKSLVGSPLHSLLKSIPFSSLVERVSIFTLSTGLWLSVNLGEIYIKLLRTSKPALDKMLANAIAKSQSTKPSEADGFEVRLIKSQQRKAKGSSLSNATAVCFASFLVDTIIAVTQNPVLKKDADIDMLLKVGDMSVLNLEAMGTLLVMVCGLSVLAVIFEQFSDVATTPKSLPPAQ
jgi:hypothetical protein